ncbi:MULTISPECIES: alanine dehydrogenase [Geomicrobium]|uniref:Alanine dehydrogenase n=1 Tax=Geomicrobium sediminis TaxID=1347788 RepID=A0ABS2P8U3_9BACL|nr:MULTISPECIES: alanine dehydrogenase [Geomicrobium]MBM7631824.1 alanine dehydrogenase [Geomicrobium sediminis]GAK09681.1 alanine dehydrogenase [Geomicrobium sp. JCM 19038]
MNIGVPKEIKNQENRVAMTPTGVVLLKRDGHQVFIETSAGIGSGFTDEQYIEAGAVIVDSAQEAWDQELIVKVKEPVQSEYGYFKEGQQLFTYLHLAAEEELTKALLESKVTAVAYETVQLPDRSLPLLTPMSEVAGRMSTQMGVQYLEKTKGGKGILLAGVPGVSRGKVTIIGGGVAGTNAAKIALGLGANVTILDLSPQRLRELDDLFGSSVNLLVSNPVTIEQSVIEADVVIGAVLIPGAKAPKLVKEETIKKMQPGSVIVDIAIDQGGIFETTDRITTHDDPVYTKHDVLHYAVANMPGAVPRTSTIALTNVTMPYVSAIANKGLVPALQQDLNLKKGLNTIDGKLTYEAVAVAMDLPFTPIEAVLPSENV